MFILTVRSNFMTASLLVMDGMTGMFEHYHLCTTTTNIVLILPHPLLIASIVVIHADVVDGDVCEVLNKSSMHYSK